jgi:condensin complex subunit 1
LSGHWSTVVLNHCKSVLRADWCNDEVEDTKRWFAAAEQALSTLFSVSAAPEQDCAEIIKALHQITLNDDQKPICSPASLARFCHVLGGCALHLLIYTEAKAAELKKVKASGAIQGTERATHGEGEKDSLESELGLAAEAELDHDQRVANIIDNEIVSSNLLAVYEPILVRLVANENGKFSNMVLREASVLALCKYMCISLSVCECHLPLLFTTLQAEKKASVRGNIVVALGDLAFRFPNAVEPWTSHIYKRLRDESSYVRSQTLMVLTHLILNDMIKVKGQVSEIVLSLEDEEPQTADLARLFFQELSKRGNNPIYNLMPDIVSRLSQDENVSRKSFRSVMPFLMSFITRDKHSESLVEKLCFRFATCSNIQQTRDVAFCLAQLPINEKALKKLDALIKTYKNALFDDEVHKSFQSLATKAKKFAKPEFREMVQEFSDKLASFNSGNGGEIKVNALGATKENTEGAGPASELPKYIEEDKIEKTKGSNFSTKASESRDKENTSTSTRRSTRVR